MSSAVMSVYDRLPTAIVRGEGCWVWDQEGNKYIDALSGIAVTALGHCHPAVNQAITEQIKKIIHTSNIFTIPEQEQLAQTLTALTKTDKAFFCNSGAEANEAAIKLARLYGHQKGIEAPQIIVMEKAYHGRTLATLSASANRKIQAGYEPLVSGFVRAPFNDLEAIRTIAKNSKNIVAIMLEPILANGGILIPADDYLAGLRKICDEHDWLLITDEIQSGVGRTGKFYAYQHSSAIPDIVTSAKALANGIPIGVCMAKNKVADLFQPGKHGSTFGGNPLACHVAQTVLKVIQQENLCENAKKVGHYLLIQLQEALSTIPEVIEVRGKGLLIGIELNKPVSGIYPIGLKNNIIFSVTAGNVIRVLPPLIISEKEADTIVERFVKTIKEFLS